MKRTIEEVNQMLPTDKHIREEEMEPWQLKEIDEARRNLLDGMEIPAMAKELIAAGARIVRLESPTEWECFQADASNEDMKRIVDKYAVMFTNKNLIN